ncbi:MAG: C40 family peptidase [Micrococcales bacterium]
MAKQGNGRHRADVETSILDFELRSRRSIREAEQARQTRKERRESKRAARLDAEFFGTENAATPVLGQQTLVVRAKPKRKITLFSRNTLKHGITMAVASGLFATFSLPAYAYNPSIVAIARFTTTSAEALANAKDTQNLTVAAVNTVKYVRGTYSSIAASQIQRERTLTAYRSYTGPTAADYLSNPPYSKIDGASVLEVANKYVGVPYVFGGDTPAGFDCSGYIEFVFAQFGIALPHSVHAQNRLGILVKPSDAQPGDLVVFDDLSHAGIFAGNGNFYHAPRPGDRVKLAPIFTSNVHYVRLATN